MVERARGGHGRVQTLAMSGDAHAILNYGNRLALSLWELDWAAFTTMPSAATAPGDDLDERGAMMDAVAKNGFVSGYSGRRISATGKLFMIDNATIWRLVDAHGEPFGVAATFRTASFL